MQDGQMSNTIADDGELAVTTSAAIDDDVQPSTQSKGKKVREILT